MGVWDMYRARIEAKGGSIRGAALKRLTSNLSRKYEHSLSSFQVHIDNSEDTHQVVIINTDNLNEKFIISMPGEQLKSGSIVQWMDNYWLVTEKDYNTEVYTKCKMKQCNYLLKWVDHDGNVFEQWCIIEDGTKYLTGEYEDRDFVVTRGDTRIALIIARNENTSKFNRSTRFLIDEPGEEIMLAYQLTKPYKLGSVYNNEGVYNFVLQEVNSTKYDNHKLGIADYYKYYSQDGTRIDSPEDGDQDSVGNQEVGGWI